MIRKAKITDLDAIDQLAQMVRTHMLSIGLKQWPGDYPNRIHFEKDIRQNGLYIYEDNHHIYGSISILPENDPAYQIINWTFENQLVVHRLFVDPNQQNRGIAMALFEYAKSLAIKNGQGLKVDTHPDNQRMQALIIKEGFQYKGYIESINRLAYEWLPNF